jgi:hypothetical protein
LLELFSLNLSSDLYLVPRLQHSGTSFTKERKRHIIFEAAEFFIKPDRKGLSLTANGQRPTANGQNNIKRKAFIFYHIIPPHFTETRFKK